MKKIIDFLKYYWNLYAPPIISFITSWVVEWNANQMVTINQYLSMTITIMCLFTVIKFIIYPNSKKSKLEKIITSPKNVKNSDYILHQEENLEHTKEIVKITKKEGIRMIKWIKKNKGAIISLFELIVSITLHLTNVINFNEPWNTIVLIVIYGIPVITAVLTSGFTSSETQEALDTLKNQLKQNKKENKQKLNLLNEQLTTAKNALNEINSNINKLELLRSINAPYDINSLSLYQAQQKQLQNTINLLEEQIKTCQNQH